MREIPPKAVDDHAPRPDSGDMDTTTQPKTTASAKQMAFLKTLFAEHAACPGITEIRTALLNTYRTSGLTSRAASDIIGWLMTTCDKPAKPAKAPQKAASGPKGGAWETIADGYYATASATGNNDLDFWMVKTATKGEWAGFRGVSRVIGGRADERVRSTTRTTALEAIASDPQAAAEAYASEIGACYRCNRHLTDETSRSLGIGPDCRAKG